MSCRALTAAVADEPALEVSVVNSRTGQPVRKAIVAIASTPAKQLSGNDGVARFAAIPPRSTGVTVHQDGYLEGRSNLPDAGTAVREAIRVRIELTPLSSVQGRVTDEDGYAVAGLSISAVSSTILEAGAVSHMSKGSALTDEDGNFRIARLRPGRYVLQTFRWHRLDEVYPQERTQAFRLAKGEQRLGLDLQVRAQKAFRIRGQIQAVPKTRVVVVLLREDQKTWAINQHVAAGQREFTLEGVAAGSYTVFAQSAGSGARTLGKVEVAVHDADTGAIVIQMMPAPDLKGIVRLDKVPERKEDQIKFEGMRVEVKGRGIPLGDTAAVDANGSFEVSGSTLWQLESPVVHGLPETLRVLESALTAGDDPLAVVVTRETAVVTGAVVDREGKPVEGVAVTASSPSNEKIFTVFTGTGGAFRIGHLPPGEHHVIAWEDLPGPEEVQAASTLANKIMLEAGMKALPDPVRVRPVP